MRTEKHLFSSGPRLGRVHVHRGVGDVDVDGGGHTWQLSWERCVQEGPRPDPGARV